MKRLGRQAVRSALFPLILITLWLAGCSTAPAAPQYAAMVMDARTGKVLHSRNADTRLHPASLTKMMTLYVAFQAIERGEISLDTQVKVSKNAAAEPPSKLYLKAGQRIKLRYLIRASAVKSANDAATTIAEAISGSEAAFTRRMNRTAKQLGMKNTTFKNAHGLTQAGHLSTARDMTILGRHVFYDYPEYYNLFSRRTTHAGVTEVANTNRRLLNAYRGADGIKTGYTRAAGSNLVASAERGKVRIIATMFGGSSSAARNKRVAELLDMGFARAPKRASVRKPRKPAYMPPSTRMAATPSTPQVRRSPLPQARPATILAQAAAARVQIAAVTPAPTEAAPLDATAEALSTELAALPVTRVTDPTAPRPAARPRPAQAPLALAAAPEAAPDGATPELVTMRQGVEQALAAVAAPEAAPANAEAVTQALSQALIDEAAPAPATTQVAARTSAPELARPIRRPARVTYSTTETPRPTLAAMAAQPVTVSTTRRSDGWGVRVGRYASRGQAERVLLRTALQQVDLLGGAKRQVVSRAKGFEVEFVGLSEQEANLTCQRLSARDERCAAFGS